MEKIVRRKLTREELNGLYAGEGAPIFVERPNVCPLYGKDHHYIATGESRPTSAWFYKTEEHYVCACGKGYWDAGLFSWPTVDA